MFASNKKENKGQVNILNINKNKKRKKIGEKTENEVRKKDRIHFFIFMAVATTLVIGDVIGEEIVKFSSKKNISCVEYKLLEKDKNIFNGEVIDYIFVFEKENGEIKPINVSEKEYYSFNIGENVKLKKIEYKSRLNNGKIDEKYEIFTS